MFGISKISSRKPIETLSIVSVVTLVCCYWLWSFMRSDEIFKRPNLEVPRHDLYYSINFEESHHSLTLIENPEAVLAALADSPKSFDVRSITLRTFGAFDSSGVLQPEYITRIANITNHISTLSVLNPESKSYFTLSDIAVKVRDQPSVFQPFSSSAGNDQSYQQINPGSAYLLLDKRYNSRGSIVGAQGAVLSFLLHSTSPQQRELNQLWWNQVSASFESKSSNLYNLVIHTKTSQSIENEHSDTESSIFNLSWIKDRSAFPLLAVVSQNVLWRIAELLDSATSSEISLVFITYSIVLMLLVHLFTSMRKYGSNISLALSVLISQIASISMTLTIFSAFGIKIDPVTLSESLPYLLIFNGFDKHLLLTRSVLLVSSHHFNKHVRPKNRELSPNFKPLNPETVSHLVIKGLNSCSSILIREYSFVLVAFLAGYMSGIAGLIQFSLFAFFVVLFDIVFMLTVFVPMLTLKLNLIYARSSVFRTHVLNSESHETINYKSLIQNASANDSNLTSKIKILVFVGYIVMIFMDFKLLPATFFSKTTPSASLKNVDSTGSELLDTLVKPLVLNVVTNISKSIEAYPVTLLISTPLEHFIKPINLPTEHSFNFSALFDSLLPSAQSFAILFALAASVLVNVYLLIRSKKSLTAAEVDTVISYSLSTASTAKPSSFFSSLNLAQLAESGTFPVPTSSASSVHTSESDEDVDAKPNQSLCAIDDIKKKEVSQLKQVKSIDSEKTLRNEHIHNSTIKRKLRASVPTKEGLELIVANNSHKALLQKLDEFGPEQVTDEEMVVLVQSGLVPHYSLEARLKDPIRAVKVRRIILFDKINKDMGISFQLPYKHYDYGSVINQCCENVIGFLPIPVGLAGPLLVNGESLFIPMATTEGALVASTSRGCKAISLSGGVSSFLLSDGMTRGPCLELPNLAIACELKSWVDSEDGFAEIKSEFESTSRFAKLLSIKATLSGRMLFMRFKTFTGDAMGMNMISKGCEKSLCLILAKFPGSKVVTISGNYCTDKKPAAINWIEGRGKSVVAEAVIPPSVVKSVLKTTIADLIEVNTKKNLVGSAMAGAIGGFNAHAANILTAIYMATGQDPAQNVESSNCLTFMQEVDGNLIVNITMPSIEVGTVGGGTSLLPQQSCLSMLKCLGPSRDQPGANAQRLAKIIAGSVMAGELSLLAALTSGDLVKSHIKLNRKPQS